MSLSYTNPSEEPIEYSILTGIAEIIKQISIENGYWTNVNPNSVTRIHTDINYNSKCKGKDLEKLPFIAVNTGTSKVKKLIGHQKEGVMYFPIMIHTYSEDNPDLELSRILKDIERRLEIENNDGCPISEYIPSNQSGQVNSIDVTDLITDEGFYYPWGVGVVQVEIHYRYYPHIQKPS